MEKIDKYYNEICAFIYGAIIYLQIDTEVAKILVYLIIIDMSMGTLKSIVIKSMTFKMNVLITGMIKKAFLLIIIMVLALLGRGLGFDDFKMLLTILMKIMLVNETLSIFNSFRSIKDKKEYKSTDFISLIIDKVEKMLVYYMDKLMKIFDDKSSCL